MAKRLSGSLATVAKGILLLEHTQRTICMNMSYFQSVTYKELENESRNEQGAWRLLRTVKVEICCGIYFANFVNFNSNKSKQNISLITNITLWHES